MRSDPEAVRRRLIDIRHNIHLAQDFAANFSLEKLKDDLLHLYAIIRCLEIISEASRHIPDAIKQRHPSIGWRDMAGAGNIYRHDYDDVAAHRVWQTLKVSLPVLLEVVEQELATLDPS